MKRDIAGQCAVLCELLALIFNSISLILIKRQGLGTVDMWLASVMATCDILLASLKLSQWVYLEITRDYFIFKNVTFSQWDGLISALFTSASVCSIGWLALLRWWAIAQRRTINNKIWGMLFLIWMLILILLLLLVANNHDFKLMPFQRYFYPNITSSHVSTILASLMLLLICLFSIVAINLCYPLMTWVYLQQLNQINVPIFVGDNQELNRIQWRGKFILTLKMTMLLIIYNLTMIPPLIIISKELITLQLRTLRGDTIFGLGFILLTLVNPLTLILLHQDTYTDLKYLSGKLLAKITKFSKRNLLIKDNP